MSRKVWDHETAAEEYVLMGADRYEGALWWSFVENNKVIVLYPGTFGAVRLVIGERNDDGFEREYTYPAEAMAAALLSVEMWDGQGDPVPGWIRSYPPFYRRRPDGRPESEYIAE